jgi:hypothetical protein
MQLCKQNLHVSLYYNQRSHRQESYSKHQRDEAVKVLNFAILSFKCFKILCIISAEQYWVGNRCWSKLSICSLVFFPVALESACCVSLLTVNCYAAFVFLRNEDQQWIVDYESKIHFFNQQYARTEPESANGENRVKQNEDQPA